MASRMALRATLLRSACSRPFGAVGLALGASPRPYGALGGLSYHGKRCFSAASTPSDGSNDVVKELRIEDLTQKVIDNPPNAGIPNEAVDIVTNQAIAELGYGPTDVLVRMFLNIHDLTGLPWWAAIIATTVVVRTAVVPLNIVARKNGARMAHFAPHFREFQERYKTDPPKTPAEQMKRSQELQALQKKHGVKFSRSLLPVFVQLPLFVTFYFALSKLTTIDPSMKLGGAFWFPDLTAPDAYAVLPIATAAIFLATIEFAPEQQAPNMQKDQAITPAKMKNIMRVVGAMMVPISLSFPSSITLYWVTSNSYTFAQNMILQNHAVMRLLDIPQPPKATAKEPGDSNPISVFARIDEMTKSVENTHATAPAQQKLQEQFAAEMQEARQRRNRRRKN